MTTNWTARDVPDQHGRVAVITGANTGLGFDTAKVLAERGATVVLAVRDVEKGTQAAARFGAGADVIVQQLDLASLESVRASAAELHDRLPKIDLLVNNAGVLYPPRQTTRDGFELQFGVNHLGHFAFTGLLLDLLLPVSGSRVVTVASVAHRLRAAIHFDDLQWEKSYDRVAAYAQAKLANLMFSYELQRRLAPRATTVAVSAHPGVARTEVMRNSPAMARAIFPAVAPLISQTSARGALPILRAATDPGALGGQYYGPAGLGGHRGNPTVVTSSSQSYDVEIQRRLWTVSEELTAVKYPVGQVCSS
jgi:NAD(P)-dependent dehydrogenase (short-subunit alcohol dehydrogenase family)